MLFLLIFYARTILYHNALAFIWLMIIECCKRMVAEVNIHEVTSEVFDLERNMNYLFNVYLYIIAKEKN